MSTLDPARAKNLLPATTLKLAEALGREEFAAKLGAPVLLVRIADGDQREVAQALAQTLSSATIPLVPTLGFRTVASGSARGGPSVAGLRPWTAIEAGMKIQGVLGEKAHVVVPLRKRSSSAGAFTDRVSVGRAMNNDIVLRHESISKLHGWIEADEGGLFYVTDAGSHNGTFVDGSRLPPRVCTLAPFGAELRFAAVTATLCRAETLWDALQSELDPS
ncbi:MAG: FHA domain-containing protein [Byssovorax sp.]